MNEDAIENITNEDGAATTATADGEAAPKKTRRGGNRKRQPPKLKDWVRVIKSQGNSLENCSIKLLLNEATGFCELITNAPASEGNDQLEGERTQVIRFTEFEVINDATRIPISLQQKDAVEDAAPDEGEPKPE